MTYVFSSCQTFAGGFDMGMTQAGLKMVGKVENVGGFGVENLEANRHLLGDAWTAQVGPPEGWEVVPAHVVIGNPPCSRPASP